MARSNLQQKWEDAASHLGLRVEIPFTVELEKGRLTVPVVLRDFGGVHGMLLVADFRVISAYVDELVKLGYGFACVSEPSGGGEPLDEDVLMEMLSDWGWSGSDSAPKWYRKFNG